VEVLILKGLGESGFCRVVTWEGQEILEELEVLGSGRWTRDGGRRVRGDWGRDAG